MQVRNWHDIRTMATAEVFEGHHVQLVPSDSSVEGMVELALLDGNRRRLVVRMTAMEAIGIANSLGGYATVHETSFSGGFFMRAKQSD